MKISKKYGVNPSLVVCPVCGKETSLALFGYMKGDAEAPKTVKGDLCDECKKDYITIVEVCSESEPKATGRRMFVPKEFINIECEKGIALMVKEEFEQLMNK